MINVFLLLLGFLLLLAVEREGEAKKALESSGWVPC